MEIGESKGGATDNAPTPVQFFKKNSWLWLMPPLGNFGSATDGCSHKHQVTFQLWHLTSYLTPPCTTGRRHLVRKLFPTFLLVKLVKTRPQPAVLLYFNPPSRLVMQISLKMLTFTAKNVNLVSKLSTFLWCRNIYLHCRRLILNLMMRIVHLSETPHTLGTTCFSNTIHIMKLCALWMLWIEVYERP